MARTSRKSGKRRPLVSARVPTRSQSHSLQTPPRSTRFWIWTLHLPLLPPRPIRLIYRRLRLCPVTVWRRRLRNRLLVFYNSRFCRNISSRNSRNKLSSSLPNARNSRLKSHSSNCIRSTSSLSKSNKLSSPSRSSRRNSSRSRNRSNSKTLGITTAGLPLERRALKSLRV